MSRPLSKVAPNWWDYTTLDPAILEDAARLSAADVEQLGRPGFRVVVYDTLEDFYLAEAMLVECTDQALADKISVFHRSQIKETAAVFSTHPAPVSQRPART